MNCRWLATTTLVALFALTGCDKLGKKEGSGSLSIASSGGGTFLIENNTHKVYRFFNGEFVETSVVPAASFSGKNGTRTYEDDVSDFRIVTNLKFLNGNLLYRIEVHPAVTKEYQEYLATWLEALRTKKPIPTAPAQQYKNPDWTSVVDKFGNLFNVGLIDSDGYEVSKIALPLANGGGATRTSIVGADGKTRAFMTYEGSIPLTGSDFLRITNSNVTYVLN